ncbi:MAG: MOSC domain-containing protein [Epsilonproteobacteria bacterium]|nr:MOSC domain-containing protein [Campylobacterota bacterium]
MQLIAEGKVLELFIALKGAPKQLRDEIEVDADGIIGDKFYAKDSNRAILLTSQESYDLAKQNGIAFEFGLLGENIILDINPYGLSCGDRVEIGTIVLEITQNCTICNSLSKIDKALPKLLQCDRGIFAKALQSGVIKKDDKVKIYKSRNNVQ